MFSNHLVCILVEHCYQFYKRSIPLPKMASRFFEIAKPIYLVWKYCGEISYKVENNRPSYLKTFSSHLILSSIFHVVVLYFSIDLVFKSALEITDMSLIEYSIMLQYNILECTYLFFISIGTKLNNQKLLDVLNMIVNLELKLSNVNMKLNHEILKFVFRIMLGLGSFPILYFTILSIYIGFNFVETSVMTWILILENIFLLKYMMILFVSKHILKLIFTQLNKLCLNPDDNSRRTLKGKIEAFKELAAICQELFELVSAFKSMVSLTVLFIFGECFAFMIFKIFSCSRLVYDLGLAEFSASVSKIVLVSSFIVYTIIMLLVYIFVTELYAKEVYNLEYLKINFYRT